MSVVTWPNLKTTSIRWDRAVRAVIFQSQFGSQSLGTGLVQWEVELAGAPEYWAQADQISAFIESLDGYANQLELWNLARPYPRGTMRGAMTLAADAAQGDTTLQISAGSGEAAKTLLKGDFLGIGSGTTQQVMRNMSDAAADAFGVISFVSGTPLRNAFPAGTPIVWDKPKALFRQKSLAVGIEYQAVIGQPWSLSLVEDWRP